MMTPKQHKHLIVRAEIENAPTSPEEINQWMRELVKQINMKIMLGPYSAYCPVEGNRGITAVTIIETSHIAMHVWDETFPALMQLDVYTCSSLDPVDVIAALERFEPIKTEIKYLDRENGLLEIPCLTAADNV